MSGHLIEFGEDKRIQENKKCMLSGALGRSIQLAPITACCTDLYMTDCHVTTAG